MVGTTGLAIYYPTDQLVPIINFTAQGSAYGSINSKKLDSLNNSESEQNPATEEIQVAIARQTAIGSSMGAVFEPSVLLGLRPTQKLMTSKPLTTSQLHLLVRYTVLFKGEKNQT